jgi:hypothetical protein
MKTLYQNFLKSLLVGAAYAATLAITKLLLSETVNARSFLWSFVGSVAAGLVLGSLAASMPAAWSRHMLVWGSAIFFNIASVTIEGRFFAPNLVKGSFIILLVQQLVVALAATWVIVKLFALIADPAPRTPIQRSPFSWLWRFVLSALSYVFFYYFFGAFDYLLVTGPYYKTHASGLVVPMQNIILQAELIRAVLIGLSVIPFLLNFPANRRRMMWLTGLILFVVGGVTPLLMQVGTLPSVVLVASAVEIFCQNVLTGVVIARLMSVDITKR